MFAMKSISKYEISQFTLLIESSALKHIICENMNYSCDVRHLDNFKIDTESEYMNHKRLYTHTLKLRYFYILAWLHKITTVPFKSFTTIQILYRLYSNSIRIMPLKYKLYIV